MSLALILCAPILNTVYNCSDVEVYKSFHDSGLNVVQGLNINFFSHDEEMFVNHASEGTKHVFYLLFNTDVHNSVNCILVDEPEQIDTTVANVLLTHISIRSITAHVYR